MSNVAAVASMAKEDDELPNGWCWTTAEELRSPERYSLAIGPFGSNLKVGDYRDEGVPLVFVREIRAKEFGGSRTKFVTSEKAQELRAHSVSGGDLLITKMGDPPGDAAIYPLNAPDGIVTADCIKLSPNPACATTSYLAYAVESPQTRSRILEITAGVAQQKISLERFRDMPLPLAPLAEQKRIADKLEAVLGRVDACRARLDRVPDLLKRFRQSVLAAATSGQLTEDWRHSQQITPDTQIVEIGEDKIEVPSNWTKGTLTEVIDPTRPLCYGVVQPGEEAVNGPLLIRVQDMLGGRINRDGLRTIAPSVDAEYKRSRIKAGDLLISVVGTIGRTSIVPTGLDANIARAVARIACRSGIDSRWMNYWLSCETLQWWLSSSSKEVARKTLNLSDIEQAPVAIPPLPEQAEIVRRVEALFAMADRIEARLTAARAQVERLTPATLSKAFRGDLVPQDPNDEPASKLLERLQSAPAPKTSRKR
jgi:type I restriction enzyme S subunit